MTPKHVPERMCALCRARGPKRELMRLVWDGQAVTLDPTGKARGRGAYVGRWRACWTDPGLVPKLQRALKAALGPDDAARLREAAMVAVDATATATEGEGADDDGGACPWRAALKRGQT